MKKTKTVRTCGVCGEPCGSPEWYWEPCRNPTCTANYYRHKPYQLTNPPSKPVPYRGEPC